jgi:hypothetical protein
LREITETPNRLLLMKKALFRSTLIFFAMICSCQKHDSAAEAQLAQRKTELDVREEAVIQREKAVEEREKSVAEREKALANTDAIQSRRQRPEAAQAEAERQRRMQQLPSQIKALIPGFPDPARMKAEKDRMIQEQLSQRQSRLEELQRTQSQMQNQNATSDTAIPATTAAPAAIYPGAEATSPSPSPTPQ